MNFVGFRFVCVLVTHIVLVRLCFDVVRHFGLGLE